MLSPMIVDRRWPTCISFAMLGDEKSTTTLHSTRGKTKSSSHYHTVCLTWALLGEQGWASRSLLPTAHSSRGGPQGTWKQASSLGLCCTHQTELGTTLPTPEAPSLTHRRLHQVHTAHPTAPVSKSHPICCCNNSLTWTSAQQTTSGRTAELPAAQHGSSLREQDACALTAVPFSFCQ